MSFRLLIHDGRYAQSLCVERLASIGRGGGNEVRLSATGVAKHHGTLRQRGDRVLYRDDKGRDTRLDGRTVREAVLSPGQSLQLGEATITVVEVIRSATAVANGVAARPAPAAPRRTSPTPRRSGRTRGWMLSVALHLLALIPLSFLTLATPPDESRPGVIAVDPVSDDAGLVDDPAREEAPELDLETLTTPPVETTAVVLPPPERKPPPEQEPEPLEIPRVPTNAYETAAGAIGVGGSRAVSTGFGKSEAGTANEQVAASFESSAFGRALLGRVRRTVHPRNVRVVQGSYDECQHVLHALEVRHGWVAADALAIRPVDPEVRVLFVNCSGTRFDPAAIRHLEAFVARGGWLFSTDWGLENVVEAAFPGYVSKATRESRPVMIEDRTIDVRLTGSGPLVRGIAATGERQRWWVEDSSLAIQVDAPSVEVLFVSKDLKRLSGSSAAAVAFDHGRGRVVHTIGHVFQQEGNQSGTRAMQRLVLNFLRIALSDR